MYYPDTTRLKLPNCCRNGRERGGGARGGPIDRQSELAVAWGVWETDVQKILEASATEFSFMDTPCPKYVLSIQQPPRTRDCWGRMNWKLRSTPNPGSRGSTTTFGPLICKMPCPKSVKQLGHPMLFGFQAIPFLKL